MTARSPLAAQPLPATALSDADVVARVLAGDDALFELLMRRHNERLFRAARAVLRDDAEAEEVLQEAWVRAWVHLRQFDGRAAFATWATRIALHEAFARRRRGRRVVALPGAPGELDGFDRLPSPTADPETAAAGHELRRLLEAAIDRLPAGQRIVFVLREVQGLSTAETAAALDVAESAVKVRLHRARARLRADLEQRAGVGRLYGFLAARCDRAVAAVLARIAALRTAPESAS